MRTKDEILKDSNDHFISVPTRDVTVALHERLTIEVLIDIRDCIQHLFDLRHAWDEEPKPPN